MDSGTKEKLDYWLTLSLEGIISTEQFAQLQDLLKTNAEARRYGNQLISLCAHLRRKNAFPERTTSPQWAPAAGTESMLRRAIDTDEQAAVEEMQREEEAKKKMVEKAAENALERFKKQEQLRQEELAYRRYLARRRQLAAGAIAALVLLVATLLVWLPRRMAEPQAPLASPTTPPVVAQITRSLNARWLQENFSVEPGTLLTASAMSLAQGFVEITFDDKTRVLLQAPSTLTLEATDRMFLRGGSVAVRILRGTEGFVVRTPTGTIVDYGTEFGVLVDESGTTEAVVFDGKVGLRSGSDPIRIGESMMLTQGQAGAVDRLGRIIRKNFRPDCVVRRMPEAGSFGIPGARFSLTEVLLGGNGFGTGTPRRMVDLGRGGITGLRDGGARPDLQENAGREVPVLPYVDYLFAPDGGAGRIQISSAGHTFAECPDTDGYFFKDYGFGRDFAGRFVELVLAGKAYGTLDAPVISMHSNIGITFDLQAIRSALSATRIRAFTGLCGISETVVEVSQKVEGKASQNRADFWVLVDGEVRFSEKAVQAQAGSIPVSVDVEDDDRFLTLIVTDGGDGQAYDWAMFANAALQLEAKSSAHEWKAK